VTARIASELGDLGGEWNRLAQASSTPFLTTEWLDSWWSAFGSGKPAWMLLCADDGSLRAGALLQNGRGGTLASAANVHTGDWDAVCRDEDARVELWDSLAGLRPGRIRLEVMPEHTGGADSAAAALETAGYRLVRVPGPASPFLALPPDWDDLLAGVSKGLRSQLGRKRRALEREGTLTFRSERADRAANEDLEALFSLEAAGWKGRAGTAILSDSRTERLYRDFAAAAARQGWFRLHSLELDGELIAADYGCAFAGGGFLIKTTFDEALARFSPGLVLRGEVLRACIEEGLRFYDFLGGPDEYKRRWAPDLRPRVAIWAYRGAALPGYVYRARLRPIVRVAAGPILRRTLHRAKRSSPS